MSNTIRYGNPVAVLAAPRQIWLATLGAAAVTREWAEKEAATLFRTLVREGSTVETHAIRYIGSRVETSVKAANTLARETRKGLDASVASIARVASRLRTRLPSVRARIDVDSAPARKSAGKVKRHSKQPVRTARVVKSRAKKPSATGRS
ncbi:MAG TPA: phasin family protein [Casimicrobiaceae bacterium]|nr:phasin family protein [Casimicrobiaceae bacterium]